MKYKTNLFFNINFLPYFIIIHINKLTVAIKKYNKKYNIVLRLSATSVSRSLKTYRVVVGDSINIAR